MADNHAAPDDGYETIQHLHNELALKSAAHAAAVQHVAILRGNEEDTEDAEIKAEVARFHAEEAAELLARTKRQYGQ